MKLIIALTNGSVVTLSHDAMNPSGRLDSVAACRLEIDYIAQKYSHFPSDQGVTVFPRQIVGIRIAEDDEPNELVVGRPCADGGTPLRQGTCTCCGQRFVEETRRRPEPGVRWGRILGPHTEEGICPACFNTYGLVHGDVAPWQVDDWVAYGTDLLRHGRTEAWVAALTSLTETNEQVAEAVAERLYPLLATVMTFLAQLSETESAAIVDQLVADLPADTEPLRQIAEHRRIELVEGARQRAQQQEAADRASREAAAEQTAALAEAQDLAGKRGTTPAIALFRKIVSQYPGTPAAEEARQWLARNS